MSLTRSFTVKTASNVWVALVGFLTSVMLNRSLGPHDYGMLVLAYAAAMFCWNFVDLGAGAALSRYLPQYLAQGDEQRAATLVRVGWQALWMGLAILGLALWILAEWLAVTIFRQPHLAPFLRLSVAYFASFSILNYGQQFLQAIQSWKAESWFGALYPTLYLAGCGLGGLLGPLSVGRVLAMNVIAALLTAGILWLSLERRKRRLLSGQILSNQRDVRQACSDIVHFGTPLLFNNLVFFVMVWADKVLMSRYRSLEELTYYYVGFAFFNALLVVSKTFYTVLLPYVSQISTEGIERTRAAFRILFFAFLQLALCLSLVTYATIGPIVNLCYGPSYHVAAVACQWLLVVFILRMLINAMGLFLLNAFGLGKTSALLSTVLIGSQVGLSLLWIPRYGWLGAVWANIAAYVLYGLAMALGVRAIRQLFSWELLLGAVGIGGFTVAVSAVAMWVAPAWQFWTIPLLVGGLGWVTLTPILRDRYQWKPAWSSWGPVLRFLRA